MRSCCYVLSDVPVSRRFACHFRGGQSVRLNLEPEAKLTNRAGNFTARRAGDHGLR